LARHLPARVAVEVRKALVHLERRALFGFGEQ
jgi:hypothetical protein